MKTSEIQKDIVNISKDHMKKKMKAIHIGDLLDGLLKKYGIKRFEDEGSDFKDRFSDIIDSMKKSEIIKEVPKGYIVVIPGGEKLIKESRTFSEHLKFLVEGKLNEAVSKDFDPDVKEVLEELPYITFNKDVLGKTAIAKLDDVKRVGTYSCNIYPNSEKDIAVTISLKPVDSNKIITLSERLINTEDSAWEKNFKKFINEARKIVEKLSELNQAD